VLKVGAANESTVVPHPIVSVEIPWLRIESSQLQKLKTQNFKNSKLKTSKLKNSNLQASKTLKTRI
jgi:hypothetical protein